MRFDGMLGPAAARIMASGNADMEHQAIDRLDPARWHVVLEIGFGPGVGIALLETRLERGWVAGADPSPVMVRAAERRNRTAVVAGRVRLAQAAAHDLPWPDATFDGIVAVNSAQLFEPLDASVAEIARVMRAEARLVTLTHDWAVRKHSDSIDAWLCGMDVSLVRHGLHHIEHWFGSARSGGTVGLAPSATPQREHRE